MMSHVVLSFILILEQNLPYLVHILPSIVTKKWWGSGRTSVNRKIINFIQK